MNGVHKIGNEKDKDRQIVQLQRVDGLEMHKTKSVLILCAQASFLIHHLFYRDRNGRFSRENNVIPPFRFTHTYIHESCVFCVTFEKQLV